MIDLDDTLAIHLNWGLEHEFFQAPAAEVLRNNPAPFYIRPDTLIEGAEMELPIILGDPDLPAEEVYGLAFSLVYDPEIIVPGTAIADFNESWFGDLGTDFITMQRDFHANGRLDIAITRLNGVGISGDGQIGRLHITIEDDILLAAPNPIRNNLAASFEIENVRLINFAEELLPVTLLPTESAVISKTNEPELVQKVKIFPNPVRENLWIRTNGVRLEWLELESIDGQRIGQWPSDNQEAEIQMQDLPDGIYLLKVITNEGVLSRRIVKGIRR